MADDTPEIQTDKDATKVVPCLECGRRLVVTLFYAPSKARCSRCRGTRLRSDISFDRPSSELGTGAWVRMVRGRATGRVRSIGGGVADVDWDTGARCPVPIRWLTGR